MPRSGRARPAKHGAEHPDRHLVHRAACVGKSLPLRLCNIKHRRGLGASPGKQFALLPAGRPHFWTTELGSEFGQWQVEETTGLIRSLLGERSAPVGYYKRGKRWRLLVFLLRLEVALIPLALLGCHLLYEVWPLPGSACVPPTCGADWKGNAGSIPGIGMLMVGCQKGLAAC